MTKLATHWLAAQWLLWDFDVRTGQAFGRGLRRWHTAANGTIFPCQGDAWGTHWQWLKLRVLTDVCWMEEDMQALAYWPELDMFYQLDEWTPSCSRLARRVPCEADVALPYWESVALAYERTRPKILDRWTLVRDFQSSGNLSQEAANAWLMRIGSLLLSETGWEPQLLFQ